MTEYNTIKDRSLENADPVLKQCERPPVDSLESLSERNSIAKAEMNRLRAGGRSGVTADFGLPTFNFDGPDPVEGTGTKETRTSRAGIDLLAHHLESRNYASEINRSTERQMTDRSGHSWVRAQDTQLNTVDQHGVAGSRDFYRVWHMRDGGTLLQEGDQGIRRPVTPGTDLRVERARLDFLAESRIADPQALAEFRENMGRLELRLGSNRQEVAQTYNQVSRLLDSGNDQIVDRNTRARLAGQVMELAATPTTIDQGAHNTCSLAALEVRTYSRQPSEAARVVAAVALNGWYGPASGNPVRLDRDSLRPDPESRLSISNERRSNAGRADRERTFASQLFQVTAANVHYRDHGTPSDLQPVPAGSVRYVQREPNTQTQGDTGERLIDTRQRPPRDEIHSLTVGTPHFERRPRLSPDDIVAISNAMTGRNESSFVIEPSNHREGQRSIIIANEDDLCTALRVNSRNLPLMIAVDSDSSGISGRSATPGMDGSGSNHFVSVTAYDPSTGIVTLDNQWGQTSDRQMTVRELFLATQSLRERRALLGDVTARPAATATAIDPNPTDAP